MLCCALLACLAAQPAAFFAAFRSRLFTLGTLHAGMLALPALALVAELAFLALAAAATRTLMLDAGDAFPLAHLCRFAAALTALHR